MRFKDTKGSLTSILSRQEGLPISRIEQLPKVKMDPTFQFLIDLQKHLVGKELLSDEIPFGFEILQSHYDHGYVKMNYGIVRKQKRLTCNRCGNNNPSLFSSFSCSRCGEKQCHYCRNCIMMGRVSECTPLYSWNGPSPHETTTARLNWEGQLSKGQAIASDRVVTAVKNHAELLVWAVCGAGKTEVLFKGIEEALTDIKESVSPPLAQMLS